MTATVGRETAVLAAEPLTVARPAGILPDTATRFVPVPLDAELLDAYRLADGELDTDVELPAPPVPAVPLLVVPPPEAEPPRFDILWRELFAAPAPQVAAEAGRQGRVVTVFSPKGGAGTTTVATNLAVLLAGHGRHSVCLVDLDLEFGDVSIMTGLAPSRSLVDAVGRTIDDATVDLVVTRWRDGIDCVLAPVDPSAAERIGSPLVAQLLARLRSRYDYVVVDTPSQLTEQVLDALDAADHQVLVTTPQLPALKSLRLVLDTLSLLGYDVGRRSVVVNQVATRTLGRDGVADAVSHPVAASVPASPDVAVAVDSGVPLALQRSDHPVVSALATFAAAAITGDAATPRARSRAPRLRRNRS